MTRSCSAAPAPLASWHCTGLSRPAGSRPRPSRSHSRAPEASQDPRSALYRLAMAHGLLEAADLPEAPAQASWEFHDRLFHHAARWFDDLIPRGGTFRFTDRFPSPPAVRASHPGHQRALDPVVVADSRPLHEIMERRRSRREMGDRPVTAAAVAEVMWRVARTTGTAREGPQDTIRRPYPSGGSLHELEFYLAISACDGLPPGFYHYRGDAHALTELDAPRRATEGLLATSAAAWGQAGQPPQVLVVIASACRGWRGNTRRSPTRSACSTPARRSKPCTWSPPTSGSPARRWGPVTRGCSSRRPAVIRLRRRASPSSASAHRRPARDRSRRPARGAGAARSHATPPRGRS